MRPWLPLVVICSPLVFPQSPADLFHSAPPQVDQALRERVQKFYQAHVDGKFRLADQYVAEDSKDAFFEAEKTRYKSFQLIKIVYSDNFKRALATVSCDTEMLVGMQRVPVKIPLTTRWKLENGEWFWYAPPPTEAVDSPFGKMKPGADTGRPSIPSTLPSPESLLQLVKVEPAAIGLSSYEAGSGEARITNGTGGTINLGLKYDAFPGFTARLDRTTLKDGESARLAIECRPADKSPKPTTTLRIEVEPFGAVFPVQVTFAVPPGVLDKLPKQNPAAEK